MLEISETIRARREDSWGSCAAQPELLTQRKFVLLRFGVQIPELLAQRKFVWLLGFGMHIPGASYAALYSWATYAAPTLFQQCATPTRAHKPPKCDAHNFHARLCGAHNFHARWRPQFSC